MNSRTGILLLLLGILVLILGSLISYAKKSDNAQTVTPTAPAQTAQVQTETLSETETEAPTEPETTEAETTKFSSEPSSETEEPYTETETKLNLNVSYGELLEYHDNGDSAVIKVKIQPQMTDKMTIDQNYFNVDHLISRNGFDKYDEIQYWAVADMVDGSESKVIQFTVPKSTIDGLKQKTIPANQLGDYVYDLWILPSLQ